MTGPDMARFWAKVDRRECRTCANSAQRRRRYARKEVA